MCLYLCSFANLDLGHQMHVHPSADSRRCIVPGFLNLCLVEIVLSADPARAVYVQSPMHGVHTWPKVLVWTPETVRASQSERDTSVPCCLYLSKDRNALDSISWGRCEGGEGGEGGGGGEGAEGGLGGRRGALFCGRCVWKHVGSGGGRRGTHVGGGCGARAVSARAVRACGG